MKAVFASIALVLALLAMPAYAFHCPKDMAQIDAALKAGPNLSAEQLTEVKKLRADGEALHKAGKHAESVETLAKAKTILGIK